MKVRVLVLIIVSLVTVSFCWANEITVTKAYSLFYKGDIEAAINMMEDYVQENPDPKAYYFLGYAYYEMKDIEKSRKYFSEAYRLKSFYSPMQTEEDR